MRSSTAATGKQLPGIDSKTALPPPPSSPYWKIKMKAVKLQNPDTSSRFAFTLVELLAVIVIIGILAAIL
ncbi:MAG: type II secretion system GspH family protein, partial [Opitutaceae bacterium]|nr:type II secretion system GspH family protein [Opitutaceae bacterium]